MPSRCVFSCSHPLWESEGTCITAGDSDVGDSCVCNPGYASRDSFGRPSCVPKKALVAVYMVLTVAMTTAWLFDLWHISQIRKLPSTTRSTRRAITRRRHTIAASVSHGGVLLTFGTAAARGGESSMWDNGMFYVMYIMGVSPLMVNMACSGELWLESIPRQLLAPGGVLASLRRKAVERNLLVRHGFANMGGFVLLALSALYFGVDTMLTIIHLILLGGCVVQAIVFTSVTVFLTHAVDSAASKAPQAWHARARKTIRWQGIALFLACVVCSIAFAVLELTQAGQGTPIIPYAVAALVGNTGTAAVIHFTKPSEPGRTQASIQPSSLNQEGSRFKVGSPFWSTIIRALPTRTGKASCAAKDAVGANSDNCGGDGVDGATEIGQVGQDMAKPRSQTGSKVIPVTDGII